MAPAEVLVSRLQPGQSSQEAEFLSQFGRCRRLVGERLAADQLYERSLALRRALKDQAGVAENLFDRALIDTDQGRTEQALAGFDKALAHLHRHVRQDQLAGRRDPGQPRPSDARAR